MCNKDIWGVVLIFTLYGVKIVWSAPREYLMWDKRSWDTICICIYIEGYSPGSVRTFTNLLVTTTIYVYIVLCLG